MTTRIVVINEGPGNVEVESSGNTFTKRIIVPGDTDEFLYVYPGQEITVREKLSEK